MSGENSLKSQDQRTKTQDPRTKTQEPIPPPRDGNQSILFFGSCHTDPMESLGLACLVVPTWSGERTGAIQICPVTGITVRFKRLNQNFIGGVNH